MKLRVLEFGENVAAGYCGHLFAQWGAEVIRADDLSRPPATGADALPRTALDAYLHPGKRRIGLDLGGRAGRALLARLADEVDVVITDAAPRLLDALDWSALGGGGPAVKAAITPFGLDGPYRDWKATGSVALAMGGYSYLIGDPGRAPLSLPGYYPEYQAGQYAYVGAVAAWLAVSRDRMTRPQSIDVSILETVTSLSQFTTVMWTFQSRIRTRHANRWENVHPLSLYRCRDGWVCLNIVHHFWAPFTEMLGRPELQRDPRFESNGARMAHRDELDRIIDAFTATRTVAEVVDLAQRRFRVPAGPLLSLDAVLGDPHLAARGVWRRLRLPDGRAVVVPGPGWRVDGHRLPEPGVLEAAPSATAHASLARETSS